MMRSQWVQAAVGTVVLTVLQSLLSFLVPAPAEPVPIGLAPVLVSNALHASLLVWIAARLRAQGLGRALVTAVVERDIIVVQNLVLLYALIFVAVNVLVDLSYAWLDPRIRY